MDGFTNWSEKRIKEIPWKRKAIVGSGRGKIFPAKLFINNFAIPMEMRGDEIWKYFIECMRSGQVIEGEKKTLVRNVVRNHSTKKPHCFRIVIEDYAFN